MHVRVGRRLIRCAHSGMPLTELVTSEYPNVGSLQAYCWYLLITATVKAVASFKIATIGDGFGVVTAPSMINDHQPSNCTWDFLLVVFVRPLEA